MALSKSYAEYCVAGVMITDISTILILVLSPWPSTIVNYDDVNTMATVRRNSMGGGSFIPFGQ